MTRRSMLTSVAVTTAVGIAGCSDTSETPDEGTNNTQNDTSNNDEQMTDETTDENEARTDTSDSDTDDEIGNPSPDAPVYETNLIETRNHAEVVIVETQENEKYIGATVRLPTVRYSSSYEEFYIFELREDGERTGIPIVVPQEKVSQSMDDQETVFTLEGELIRIGTLEGGEQLVVSGDNFVLEEQ